jgi:hypothetical protein
MRAHIPTYARAWCATLSHARTRAQFVAESEGELGLVVGDIVCVLSRDADGWWKGIFRGARV